MNNVKNVKVSSIQQATQIVNNGMDRYAVVEISQDTTQQELAETVGRINAFENELQKNQIFISGKNHLKNLKMEIYGFSIKEIIKHILLGNL